VLEHSRACWHRVHELFGESANLTTDVSIWFNPAFKIQGHPFLWTLWSSRVISRLSEVWGPSGLLSFPALQEAFQLPSTEFFQYMQLRSCLRGVPALAPGLLPTSPIVDIKRRFQNNKGGVAKIYASLLSRVPPDRLSTKAQWEKELGHSLSEDGWEEALGSPTQAGTDLRVRLIQFKIINRLYWPPSRLTASGLRESDLCWRCGFEKGDTLHMLWKCEKLHPFIREITGYSLMDSLINYILGINLIRAKVSKIAWELIQLALSSAKCVILRHWWQEEPPSVREWLLLMADTAVHEQVIRKSRNKLSQLRSIWSFFLDRVSEIG
uniref:Reverse transcriptase zinc-binding domain-containing protein n=1 Tax=Latimeria chalumnae TaxID=7897 RepID=H3ABB1_LATCH